MKTRTQQYAKEVFELVSGFKKQHTNSNGKTDDAKIKEYGSMAHKLPVLIRTAGLAQALAFVEASGSKKQEQKQALHPHRQLLEDLAKTIVQSNAERFQNAATLLTASREQEIDEYLRLTREALAALLWFKRFAQSVLDVEAGDEPGGDRQDAA
jgi:CRISPR-associated protein Cmr5